MSLHHPVTQIEYLRQCLSNAKRPIGLFLGAGCPMAVKIEDKPLIPDIVGITTSVCELLNESEELHTVIANIEGDGFEEPTIEDVFTHVRGLQAIAGEDIVRNLSKEQLSLDRYARAPRFGAFGARKRDNIDNLTLDSTRNRPLYASKSSIPSI